MSPSFGAAIMAVGMMSIGTALFHPQGTGRSGSSAGKNRLAFSISLFAASGSLGSSISPLYVVFMVSVLGRRLFPLALIPVFTLCFFIWKNTATPLEHQRCIITGDKTLPPDANYN